MDAETLQLDTRQTKRQQDKEFLKYISDRTSFIHVDCTPKDDAAKMLKDLGVKNPSGIGDGWGSGIIVRSKENASYIFTAAHVVVFSDKKMAKHFTCVINVQRSEDAGTSNRKYVATIVTEDSNRDIAVLRVEADLGVNTILAAERILGEDIWAAGFPVQKLRPNVKRLSVTKGVLSTLNVPSSSSPHRDGNYDRVSSQIYFGNSGGGIWNQEGELVAVVNLMIAGGGSEKIPYEGYYYVKPIKEIITMLSRNNKYQEVFGSVD